jgi:hypothetical protein
LRIPEFEWLPRLLIRLWWWLEHLSQPAALHGYPHGLSTSEIVSVTVALTALLISAASLWLTALRPARFNLTYMHEHTKIGRGGRNEVPNICSIRAFMALTNSGARAGLLERVGWGNHFEVKADAALMFAVGPVAREGRECQMVRLDGKALIWPRVIQAGDVRALELDFEMGGDLLRARNEGWEDLVPIAELVAKLESVSIGVHLTYRSGSDSIPWLGYLYRQRQEVGTFYVWGAELRRTAAEYWSEIGRDDLAKIVHDSFTGRDIDKL